MMTAILLSGGTGTRLGSEIPKQYIEVNGKPIISYCIETLSGSAVIDKIVIAADSKWQERIREWIAKADAGDKFCGFAEPGENRQLSIYNGLKLIKEKLHQGRASEDEDYVFIHDAARPLLSGEDITAYVSAAPGHDGVLPVLPMKDTVYLSRDGRKVSSLLERKEVFAGQAPEIFRFEKYLQANERLIASSEILSINGATEPAILAEMDIVMAPGDEGNFKITTAEDLERFRLIVSEQR